MPAKTIKKITNKTTKTHIPKSGAIKSAKITKKNLESIGVNKLFHNLGASIKKLAEYDKGR
jgi:hypothetical protein